jgi:putative ABC transport system substrate-binding protein
MIGLIGADPTSWGPWTAAFAARLRELGWIEGRTVAIEYRWTEGRPERPAEFAAEFARLNADIIVTNSSAAPTVKQATSTIPIVFVLGKAHDSFRGQPQRRLPRPLSWRIEGTSWSPPKIE